MKKELNIVWLKRDIRTIDHEAQCALAENLKVITLLFIFFKLFVPNELF